MAEQLRLSNSEEIKEEWTDFSILGGVDEKEVHDGPGIFDTEELNKVGEAKRFLLEHGIKMTSNKSS